MKGLNTIARARSVEQGVAVHSIFQTIQGEGPMAGHPSIFVRFAGCNLQCHFCDTEFDATQAPLTVANLAKQLAKFRAALVNPTQYRYVFTGGEPMLQPLTELISVLRIEDSYPSAIDIETAGTVWPSNFELLDPIPFIVCSPKTPKVHPEIKWRTSAWKYIIRAGETAPKDGLPIRSTQRLSDTSDVYLYRPSIMDPQSIYVQPCDEGDAERNKRNLDEAVRVSMQFGYRLSIQLHKIAGLA